ncbi:hypothetical protein ACIA5H_36475 [Nocardia sp. NPDC051900]|uniref:hypothetical protein n=1 Tax=Nocardia sp. NPDC051900 TaxID=3364326 RepID=UPI0037BD77CF
MLMTSVVSGAATAGYLSVRDLRPCPATMAKRTLEAGGTEASMGYQVALVVPAPERVVRVRSEIRPHPNLLGADNAARMREVLRIVRHVGSSAIADNVRRSATVDTLRDMVAAP